MPFFTMETLLKHCQDRIDEMLDAVKQAAENNPLIIVADSIAVTIISSIESVLDLTRRGITVIEALELDRKELNNIHALYIL